MGFGNGLQWLTQCLPTETVVFPFGRSVIAFHDERRRTVDNKALYAARDALQGIFCQRLFAPEYRWGRN